MTAQLSGATIAEHGELADQVKLASLPVHPCAELFPMLAPDELTELASNIAEHGLREPVWLWRDGGGTELLLDGRNRVAACRQSGVEITSRFYVGDDPVGFVVSQNIARRHLTPSQRAMLALELVPLFEAEAEARRRVAIGKARRETVATRPPSDPMEPKSRDKAAKMTGASGRHVSRAKRVTAEAPDLAAKVRAGDMDLGRADRIIRDRQAEERRAEKARHDAAATGVYATVDIRHGDFRDVLAELTGVDAVVTDPPYGHEFLPLLADLAAWADKVLTPDGVLAVLIGQTHLPEVYRLLDGGRPYRWTGCLLGRGGRSYMSQGRRINCDWKPVLVYGGGKEPSAGILNN